MTALPTYQGDALPKIANYDKTEARWGRWMGAFRGARPVQIGARISKQLMLKLDTKSVQIIRTDNLRVSNRSRNFVTRRDKNRSHG